MKKVTWLLAAAVALVFTSSLTYAQMNKPETVTIEGKLVDLSCSAKGMAMMNSDYNALNNTHKTPKGEVASCATMCLKTGQPAGIYKDGKIAAVLVASPSVNLYKFAAEDVEIQGWWAGSEDDAVATFFPENIRRQGEEEWTKVIAAQMHE